MLGPSAESVVQSLSRSRRYHGLSLGLALLALALLIMSPPEATISAFGNYKAPIERFALFAMIFTAGALSFVKAFLEDALDGTRCLRDRESAIAVGRFPWILTRFTGRRWDKRLLSFISRFVVSFHPIVYVMMPRDSVSWYEWGLGVTILFFSVWIFLLSQKFQRPILFDSKTESHKKRDINAISRQLEDVLEQLKSGDGVQKIAPSTARHPQLQVHSRENRLDPVIPAQPRVPASSK
jgi:hypothetical protein